MAICGISRAIPASRRHLLLDICSDINAWPGYRELRAQNLQGGTRITYTGQAGNLSLMIGSDEDFAQRLIAVHRLIEHDKNVSRIIASKRADLYACDYDPDTSHWVDNDMPPPLWAWEVPEALALAYTQNLPKGFTRFFNRTADIQCDESGNFEKARVAIKAVSHIEDTWINFFSFEDALSHLSYNRSDFYLKIKNQQLPCASLPILIGKPFGRFFEHSLVHPETIIRNVKQGSSGLMINLWKTRAVLQGAPLQSLDDVNAAWEAERSCR